MDCRLERFQSAIPADHRFSGWVWGRCPVGQGETDRLTELVDRVIHGLSRQSRDGTAAGLCRGDSRIGLSFLEANEITSRDFAHLEHPFWIQTGRSTR